MNLFRAEFMSLSHPHPIWTSAGSSPFEVKKANVQARMLSGSNAKPGTLQHMATGEFSGLASALTRAVSLWDSFQQSPELYQF